NGNRITGTSYHYSDTSNYVKEEFEGNFDREQNKIQIQEMKVSVFKIPPDCIPCIKNYTLSFHTDGKEEQLRGGWTGKTMDGKSSCPAGSIVLTRASKSDFEPTPPPVFTNRTND